MTSENLIVFRGATGTVFAAPESVSGRVDDAGESWTIKLAGTRDAIAEFVRKTNTPRLFVGSTWTPSGISIPSRNTPRITGWEPTFSGATGALKIAYGVNPNETEITLGSDTLPAETVEERITACGAETALSECPAIFGAGNALNPEFKRVRAAIVEYAKAFLSIRKSSENYAALVATWQANFCAEMVSLGETCAIDDALKTAPETSLIFARVRAALADGIDRYIATAYKVSVVENLNSKPALGGLNTYNTPRLRRLALPSDANARWWWQDSDELSALSNGQFRRARSWLGVAAKSILYADAD